MGAAICHAAQGSRLDPPPAPSKNGKGEKIVVRFTQGSSFLATIGLWATIPLEISAKAGVFAGACLNEKNCLGVGRTGGWPRSPNLSFYFIFLPCLAG